jgi:hypothetical protein
MPHAGSDRSSNAGHFPGECDQQCGRAQNADTSPDPRPHTGSFIPHDLYPNPNRTRSNRNGDNAYRYELAGPDDISSGDFAQLDTHNPSDQYVGTHTNLVAHLSAYGHANDHAYTVPNRHSNLIAYSSAYRNANGHCHSAPNSHAPAGQPGRCADRHKANEPTYLGLLI